MVRLITHAQSAPPLSAEQKARLSKLKGATLRGVIAIQDRPNEYFFSVVENLIY
ncbi:hypothetical protein [Moraxella bovoculi]|uniref:hypothetical protein n=1 Tax=Moraxella bovoculi TaxID=386891 RepID=UPI001314C077|nr:hypothetical protein [Moraxella bovoculi]